VFFPKHQGLKEYPEDVLYGLLGLVTVSMGLPSKYMVSFMQVHQTKHVAHRNLERLLERLLCACLHQKKYLIFLPHEEHKMGD